VQYDETQYSSPQVITQTELLSHMRGFVVSLIPFMICSLTCPCFDCTLCMHTRPCPIQRSAVVATNLQLTSSTLDPTSRSSPHNRKPHFNHTIPHEQLYIYSAPLVPPCNIQLSMHRTHLHPLCTSQVSDNRADRARHGSAGACMRSSVLSCESVRSRDVSTEH
jgi:hypothetical protein